MVYTPETKWNADDDKIQMLMEIEKNLEDGFINKDVDDIFDYLFAYRRQSFPKFNTTTQNAFNTNYKELEKKYTEYKKNKTSKNFNDFYSWADALFLSVSQKIKEAGIYYREGKDARHAILER